MRSSKRCPPLTATVPPSRRSRQTLAPLAFGAAQGGGFHPQVVSMPCSCRHDIECPTKENDPSKTLTSNLSDSIGVDFDLQVYFCKFSFAHLALQIYFCKCSCANVQVANSFCMFRCPHFMLHVQFSKTTLQIHVCKFGVAILFLQI